MAFNTGHLNDPQSVQSGTVQGSANIIYSNTAFEDELVVGRFAKFDNSAIENIDGSVTPTVVGVVVRDAALPASDAVTYDSDLYSQIDFIRHGLVVIEASATKNNITYLADVSVENTVSADYGKAIAAADAAGTDVTANAEYIETVGTNLWLIRLK